MYVGDIRSIHKTYNNYRDFKVFASGDYVLIIKHRYSLKL